MTTTHSSRETMGSMAATLKMPYTLTPGRATGIFLAALAQQQILGSRCTACSTVRVPAQDVCPDCGGESPEIVRVPETGVLEAWTQTDQGVIALVRLDGTDIPLLHRVNRSVAWLNLLSCYLRDGRRRILRRLRLETARSLPLRLLDLGPSDSGGFLGRGSHRRG